MGSIAGACPASESLPPLLPHVAARVGAGDPLLVGAAAAALLASVAAAAVFLGMHAAQKTHNDT